MATTLSRTRPSSILLPSPASPPPTAKRIQFAPLPVLPKSPTDEYDPEPPTEDILVSSSSSSSSSQLSSSTTSTPTISCDLDKSSPDSSVGSSPVTPLTALPSKFTSSPIPPSPQLSWVKKPQISLLRPFKRFSTSSSASSSHTLTPTPSIDTPRRSITKEDVLTLGTVNLFRTTSRESTRSSRDNDSSWSLGLSRWSSLGGSTSNFPSGSSSHSRNQSTQSLTSKASSRFSSFSSSSSSSSSDSKSNPKTTQQPKANKYKGTRMLNGRVYGAPKRNPNANPFANARDEEPEFVEWGYGGMGSVKGAKSAGVGSNWERLQGGSIDVGVGGVGAGIGAGDAELDDGSGLAWVKRRREERERKAREQKEKEAAEKEKENSESQTNTPVPTRSPTLESIPTLAPESVIHAPPTIDVPPLTDIIESQDGEDAETATKANFPTPKRYPAELDVSSLPPHTEDVQSKAEEGHNAHETERVLQAITVPVRSPRHHHHHRQPSKVELVEVALAEGPIAPQVVESPSTTGGDTTKAATSAIHTSTTELEKSVSFSSSSSESGSGSEGGFDDDDSDYEEEEEEQESQTQNVGLKSPLGTAAGVEKISRHKE